MVEWNFNFDGQCDHIMLAVYIQYLILMMIYLLFFLLLSGVL